MLKRLGRPGTAAADVPAALLCVPGARPAPLFPPPFSLSLSLSLGSLANGCAASDAKRRVKADERDSAGIQKDQAQDTDEDESSDVSHHHRKLRPHKRACQIFKCSRTRVSPRRLQTSASAAQQLAGRKVLSDQTPVQECNTANERYDLGVMGDLQEGEARTLSTMGRDVQTYRARTVPKPRAPQLLSSLERPKDTRPHFK